MSRFARLWDDLVLPARVIGVPPVWRWGARKIGIDALHHLVQATVTSATSECLDALAIC
jgi:hypothetical protein